MVSLTLARNEVPVPIGLRLFLPELWAADAGRCAEAGVPAEHRRVQAKTEIALAEIDRVRAAGARFGRVVADAGYGVSAAFRQGLSERGLIWAVGIPKVQNLYPTTVQLHWPKAETGRVRKHPVPSEDPVADEFAALRVRLADGAQLRHGRHLPGDEVWPDKRARNEGPPAVAGGLNPWLPRNPDAAAASSTPARTAVKASTPSSSRR